MSDACSIDIGFHEFDNFLSVAVSPREGLTLPLTSEPAYTPVDREKYPVILTQVGTHSFHPSEVAACYILRLVDGSSIIYDTPNKNGVYGWFLADDGIQIFTLCGKDRVSVGRYATREAYLMTQN